MATSVLAAFGSKWDSIAGLPALTTFDEPVQIEQVQVYPPYAVLIDGGTVPQYDFEHNAIEVTTLTVFVVDTQLANVDAAVERAKYNGGSTTAGLGLDFGTLPALAAPYTELVVMRTYERRFAFHTTGKQANRVHACELRYQVTLRRA